MGKEMTSKSEIVNNKRLKVCMVLFRHSALDDRIFYKESRTLQQAGYEVHIICRLQNNAFTDMGGQPVGYPDENGIWKFEGIIFHGIPRRKGIFGRWKEYKEVVQKGVSINADIYHCHESDIALNASIKIKHIINTILIYDIHEFGVRGLRDVLGTGIKNIIIYFSTKSIKNAIKHLDYIISANSIVRAQCLIHDRFKKVEIIPNVPELSIFKENDDIFYNRSSTILCHEGALNFNRGLKEMISLIRMSNNDVRLKIVGNIRALERQWLDNIIESDPDLEKRIIITGWIPYEMVGKEIDGCNIGLILFYPTVNNMLAGPPNKLFNYMRYGIPIISFDLPETRYIINKYGCGIIVKEWSLEYFLSAVKYLINNPDESKAMGQKGKDAIINELSWQKQGKRLLSIYDELLNQKPFIKS